LTIEEIRVDLKPVEKTVKGEHFSIAVPEKIRPSDKVYQWRPVTPKDAMPQPPTITDC
jgi:putative protease